MRSDMEDNEFSPKRKILGKKGILYLVTALDDKGALEEALTAGVDFVQLREKNVTSAQYLERAVCMRGLVDRINRENGHGTLFIVNDRLDIALLSGADGVHLGSDDVPVGLARSLAGDGFIIGATAKTVETAVAAQAQGADYIGTGAFASTSTKPDATLITRELYSDILDNISIPDYAIGGITAGNAQLPLECGAWGLAVSAGIMRQKSPGDAVREFRRILAIIDTNN
jgi:thiamine-phosphate diphosphorylase